MLCIWIIRLWNMELFPSLMQWEWSLIDWSKYMHATNVSVQQCSSDSEVRISDDVVGIKVGNNKSRQLFHAHEYCEGEQHGSTHQRITYGFCKMWWLMVVAVMAGVVIILIIRYRVVCKMWVMIAALCIFVYGKRAMASDDHLYVCYSGQHVPDYVANLIISSILVHMCGGQCCHVYVFFVLTCRCFGHSSYV